MSARAGRQNPLPSLSMLANAEQCALPVHRHGNTVAPAMRCWRTAAQVVRCCRPARGSCGLDGLPREPQLNTPYWPLLYTNQSSNQIVDTRTAPCYFWRYAAYILSILIVPTLFEIHKTRCPDKFAIPSCQESNPTIFLFNNCWYRSLSVGAICNI